MLNLNTLSDKVKFQHYNLERDPFISKFQDNSINTIFQDSKGEIWVGGYQGIFKLMRDSNGEIYFKLVNKNIGLPNVAVKSISEDVYGRLLIGSNYGLFMLNRKKSPKIENIVNNIAVNQILVDNRSIWVGTNNGLLYLKNSKKHKNPKLVHDFKYNPNNPTSLSKNTIKSLLKDKAGVIWIGTNGGGLNKLDLERKQFKNVKKTLNPTSLSYDKIRSMFEDSNGTLWIGREGGGLNMLLKDKNKGSYLGFKIYNNLRNVFATIEIERKGKKILIIGSENFPGLYEIDITQAKEYTDQDIKPFKDIFGSVFSLLEDKDKNLWIGTYNNGIVRWLYNKERNSYKKDFFIL